ncbi:MAG: hypothetical protein PHR78_01680 [Eubacteriales bacterium]|nr:hypothetical protein [Eubacteriales bacterium]MDD4324278.1 hypothetical protein [Eubacteriales bacterium]MDD4540866.1 hypothetical protein [Eubacteriales bacterium]
MNKSNKRNGIVIVLSVLLLVVWGMAIAGWIKGSSDSSSLSANSRPDTSESRKIEQTVPREPSSETLPSQENHETMPIETPAQTQVETSEQTQAPLLFDASGIWDMTFRRYYSIESEGSWGAVGMEEVFLWMDIYPGQEFECEIMPYDGNINGESYGDSLAIEPQLHTGELAGNTMRLYLDLDDFYLDPSLEVADTIQPDYIEIPITTENGLSSGIYDFTWLALVDEFNVQSRVTIELIKR